MIYKLVSKDIVNKPREVYACIIYELIKRENNIYTFHIHELKTVLPYFELMFYLIYTLLSKTCGMCLSLFFFFFFLLISCRHLFLPSMDDTMVERSIITFELVEHYSLSFLFLRSVKLIL